MGAGCELQHFGPEPIRPLAQGQWRRPRPGAGTPAAAPPPPPEATCGRGQAWEPGGRPVRPRVRSPPADRTAPNCNSLGSEAQGAWGGGGDAGPKPVPCAERKQPPAGLRPCKDSRRQLAAFYYLRSPWFSSTFRPVKRLLAVHQDLVQRGVDSESPHRLRWPRPHRPRDPRGASAGCAAVLGTLGSVWGPDSRRVQSAPSEGIL